MFDGMGEWRHVGPTVKKRKAPFEATLPNLSSSEPIQNLSFNLTTIAYVSHKQDLTKQQFTLISDLAYLS